MTVYVCSELDGNDECIEWVESAHVPTLSMSEASELGAGIVGLMIIAFCIREIYRLILNRR